MVTGTFQKSSSTYRAPTAFCPYPPQTSGMFGAGLRETHLPQTLPKLEHLDWKRVGAPKAPAGAGESEGLCEVNICIISYVLYILCWKSCVLDGEVFFVWASLPLGKCLFAGNSAKGGREGGRVLGGIFTGQIDIPVWLQGWPISKQIRLLCGISNKTAISEP